MVAKKNVPAGNRSQAVETVSILELCPFTYFFILLLTKK
jgi:hypothetical protein